MELYHGTQKEFEKFDVATCGKGNDEHGAGFYLTSKRNNAWSYGNKTNAQGFIYTVEFLPSGRLVKQSDTISQKEAQSLIEHLLDFSPIYNDTLENFGENPARAKKAAIAAYMSDDEKDIAESIGADFYGEDYAAEYMRALVSYGISAFELPQRDGITWFVCFNARELEITETEILD